MERIKQGNVIYKLINENMTLVTVMDQMMSEFGDILSMRNGINKFYVDSLNNIFVLDVLGGNVFKWTVNSTYFMLVADSQKFDSYTNYGLSSPQALAIDEINNIR